MKTRTTCRLCDSETVRFVSALHDMPLVDRYSREENREALYPCTLQMCGACGHIQLREVVAPELLFGDEYLFRTADYAWLAEHYSRLADALYSEFAPHFVLEIGSNDGTLLAEFQRYGCHVLGFDPSGVPASVPTIRERFDRDSPAIFADLIIANHVFAHNDDLQSIVRGIEKHLLPLGVFVFETNYALDMMERHLFDIVYHEHMDYHSVVSLAPFFARFGLELFRVQTNDSKGGTLRGYVCRRGAHGIEPSVSDALELERACGLDRPAIFEEWNARLAERREKLRLQLGDAPCVGYGAAAGGIATLYQMGLEHRTKWLVDDSPRRHGLRAPHCNLEVMDTRTLYNYDTHHGFMKVVALSWRYAAQIQAKHPNLEIIVP